MKKTWQCFLGAALILLAGALPAPAVVNVQCPGDTNGDAVIDSPDPAHPTAVCVHLAAGDGFINMSDKIRNAPDGKRQYIFGFADVTGVAPDNVMLEGMLAANFSAPTIQVAEGGELYLSLTNVGMMMRPDLFDPHTVHWHGFPQASVFFDGVPDASISVVMGASLTYYYKVNDPGTYMYHCHVEATEHMQMGMLGNIYVYSAQDGTTIADPDGTGRSHDRFVYNDGDGSTGYDVDYPIQIASFDPEFHDASINVQPLPFAAMDDKYPMLNGRGYPYTTVQAPLANSETGHESQKTDSLIEAAAGQKILLRISSLSTTSFHTLEVLGIPMKVVGKDARILRGPSPDGGVTPGIDLSYYSNSVTLGGGQAVDVILDTLNVPPGTYFLYARELNHLNNNQERRGGMMTEIRIQ